MITVQVKSVVNIISKITQYTCQRNRLAEWIQLIIYGRLNLFQIDLIRAFSGNTSVDCKKKVFLLEIVKIYRYVLQAYISINVDLLSIQACCFIFKFNIRKVQTDYFDRIDNYLILLIQFSRQTQYITRLRTFHHNKFRQSNIKVHIKINIFKKTDNR